MPVVISKLSKNILIVVKFTRHFKRPFKIIVDAPLSTFTYPVILKTLPLEVAGYHSSLLWQCWKEWVLLFFHYRWHSIVSIFLPILISFSYFDICYLIFYIHDFRLTWYFSSWCFSRYDYDMIYDCDIVG